MILMLSASISSRLSHHYPTLFFFFTDTATTKIYTLSLHDALPICAHSARDGRHPPVPLQGRRRCWCAFSSGRPPDRKSTRLNSSHTVISYAVFCLKKKKNGENTHDQRGENGEAGHADDENDD